MIIGFIIMEDLKRVSKLELMLPVDPRNPPDKGTTLTSL